MKKVITMVGTSLFENYFESESETSTIKKSFEKLKEKRSKNWDSEKGRIEMIKKGVTKWINARREKTNISAEVESLVKLKEEIKDDMEIYLLCSDTILSKLAGEIIQEIVPQIDKLSIKNKDEIKIKVIEGLQVWNRKEFKEGLEKLVNEIEGISDGFWDNVVINITGGYKATIPYLTILAQIFQCPLYYIFEDTNELICIDPGPLNVDWGIFEKYSSILDELSNGVYDLQKFREKYSQFDSFYSDLKSLVWADEKENLAELNPLGKIFWKFYVQHIPVYITRESEYFRLNLSDKRKIHNAIRELYERLEKVLVEIPEKKEAIRKIAELTDQNDLRHGPIIDSKYGVFIFKSTNEDQIRLLYSFDISKNQVSSITIYDFKYGKFKHNEYIDEFKKKYPDLKNLERICIPIKRKGGGMGYV